MQKQATQDRSRASPSKTLAKPGLTAKQQKDYENLVDRFIVYRAIVKQVFHMNANLVSPNFDLDVRGKAFRKRFEHEVQRALARFKPG
jgi:hypothetical protein